MSTITLNGHTLDIGDARLSVSFHTRNEEAAATAVRNAIALAGDQWAPRFDGYGSSVWLNQSINVGTEEEPVTLSVTVYLPDDAVPRPQAPELKELAQAWLERVLGVTDGPDAER